MGRVLLICFAGAIGTGARYWVSDFAMRAFGPGFPYGTLIVNVVGSMVLAVVMYLASTAGIMSPTLRLTLGTGFCGGFTTYSTFNYETMRAFQEGSWLIAGMNVVVTVVTCLGAAFLGWTVARWVFSR